MKLLFSLFLAFAKVGVMTFGGGYAMLPILQREIVQNKGWASETELTDYFAIGQCTPGIIAVNTATFVGLKQSGFWGAIFATCGIVFPSLIIITALAGVISTVSHLPVVINAFAGINVCVGVLILNSVKKLFKKSAVDLFSGGIFLIVVGFSLFSDLSPVIFVILSGIFGILYTERRARRT